MINLYRTELETASRRELIALIEAYALGIDYHIEDDVYELREYTLDALEREGQTIFEAVEDDILDDLCNGNWTDGVHRMREHSITPNSLINWIEEQREELGEDYHSHFDLGSAVAVTELYNRERLEVC